MVSFVCEVCQETIKKPKLDQHSIRCPNAQFTCIDCSTTFTGTNYRTHTQCITEAEKYQKGVHEGKKGKNKNVHQKQQKTSGNVAKETYKSSGPTKQDAKVVKKEIVNKPDNIAKVPSLSQSDHNGKNAEKGSGKKRNKKPEKSHHKSKNLDQNIMANAIDGTDEKQKIKKFQLGSDRSEGKNNEDDNNQDKDISVTKQKTNKNNALGKQQKQTPESQTTRAGEVRDINSVKKMYEKDERNSKQPNKSEDAKKQSPSKKRKSSSDVSGHHQLHTSTIDGLDGNAVEKSRKKHKLPRTTPKKETENNKGQDDNGKKRKASEYVGVEARSSADSETGDSTDEESSTTRLLKKQKLLLSDVQTDSDNNSLVVTINKKNEKGDKNKQQQGEELDLKKIIPGTIRDLFEKNKNKELSLKRIEELVTQKIIAKHPGIKASKEQIRKQFAKNVVLFSQDGKIILKNGGLV